MSVETPIRDPFSEGLCMSTITYSPCAELSSAMVRPSGTTTPAWVSLSLLCVNTGPQGCLGLG